MRVTEKDINGLLERVNTKIAATGLKWAVGWCYRYKAIDEYRLSGGSGGMTRTIITGCRSGEVYQYLEAFLLGLDFLEDTKRVV